MIPSIVLLGNLLVDDVVHADGATRMGQPGGALLYAPRCGSRARGWSALLAMTIRRRSSMPFSIAASI